MIGYLEVRIKTARVAKNTKLTFFLVKCPSRTYISKKETSDRILPN